MRVEQHLVGLQRIGADEEGAAVAKLEMRRLQLYPLAADDRPVLAPVELKRFARLEYQGNESASAGRLLLLLPMLFPAAGKRRNTTVRPLEPECHQVRMQLLDRPPLLARPAALQLEPGSQLGGKCVQLAGPLRQLERRLHHVAAQVFADGVPRQPSPAGNLTDRKPVPQRPAADHTQ